MVSEKGGVVNGAWKNFCPAFCCFLGIDFVEYAQGNQMHDGCRTAYYTKWDGLPRGKCCAGDEKHYHLLTECGIIKTDEPRTLDFSGVRGFLVTNVCIVQRSAA